jgi:16S rRNA (uracil1498-N3)-methyltransferase
MRHLFLKPADLQSEIVTISGPDFHHLANVLRVRIGERIVLLNNLGQGFEAEIASLERKTASARVLGQAKLLPEPAIHITVAQAVGKGDKLEHVIQHGTEVGASAFIPLFSERTVVRSNAFYGEEKLERLSKIAKGAAEQCERPRIPEIQQPVKFSELLKRVWLYDEVLCLDPSGPSLTDLQMATNDLASERIADETRKRFLLCVGPEGGFSNDELKSAATAGARITSVGDYVLRTETAALVALSRLMMLAGI